MSTPKIKKRTKFAQLSRAIAAIIMDIRQLDARLKVLEEATRNADVAGLTDKIAAASERASSRGDRYLEQARRPLVVRRRNEQGN